MSNIEISKDFQTKIFERIRDSIGDLMTDDDLKKLVEASVRKVFFEDRVILDNYGSRRDTKPPLIAEQIQGLLKDRVSAAVKEWIDAHQDDVKAAIDAAIAKGMFALVQQHFESRTSGPMYELAQRLQQKGVLL
jgi:hypothetical protein